MPLNADVLLERIKLKSQVTRWRAMAIVALVGTALLLLPETGGNIVSGTATTTGNFIARVTIEGVILDDAERDKLFEEIADNPRAKALIVKLNTPGGSTVGGMTLYRQLRELSQDIPVVAVMRDLSASAGYLTAIGADRIFANEGTLTGSIGVLIQTAEFTELAEKIGVTPITVKTGKYKAMLSPYEKSTPEVEALLQTVIDDFYNVFVDTVAERRKLPREKVLAVADGRVMTGRQAVGAGLIDAIGGEDEAIAWMEKEKKLPKDLKIVDMEVKPLDMSFLERLSESVFPGLLPASTGKLDGLISIWHPNVQLQ